MKKIKNLIALAFSFIIAGTLAGEALAETTTTNTGTAATAALDSKVTTAGGQFCVKLEDDSLICGKHILKVSSDGEIMRVDSTFSPSKGGKLINSFYTNYSGIEELFRIYNPNRVVWEISFAFSGPSEQVEMTPHRAGLTDGGGCSFPSYIPIEATIFPSGLVYFSNNYLVSNFCLCDSIHAHSLSVFPALCDFSLSFSKDVSNETVTITTFNGKKYTYKVKDFISLLKQGKYLLYDSILKEESGSKTLNFRRVNGNISPVSVHAEGDIYCWFWSSCSLTPTNDNYRLYARASVSGAMTFSVKDLTFSFNESEFPFSQGGNKVELYQRLVPFANKGVCAATSLFVNGKYIMSVPYSVLDDSALSPLINLWSKIDSNGSPYFYILTTSDNTVVINSHGEVVSTQDKLPDSVFTAVQEVFKAEKTSK